MIKIATFVTEHADDDTSRLILDREKWPDIDMSIAVNSIEGRRKLKGKVSQWHDCPGLVFPLKLSAEQCSSSATALYKSSLAEKIAGRAEWRIADLTGGLGVDSWFFSLKAARVLYNERMEILCEAARHNFKVLKAGNIEISNFTVVSSDKRCECTEKTPSMILEGFSPDIVYMDPARRSETGRKVFLIEDCSPDVLTLKDEIFEICRHILIKLSPMADISMVCSRLGKTCREVHVTSYGGECKELLIWMDKEWDGDYTVTASEIGNGGSISSFCFIPSEEKNARAVPFVLNDVNDDMYLFEPGKALMKAGPFNLISERYGLSKLGVSTHLYMTGDSSIADELKKFGKLFRIKKILPLDKRNIKAVGKEFPKAEVTARNIPMDSETLRNKLGTTSGDDAHIFGLKSDHDGNLIFITDRI